MASLDEQILIVGAGVFGLSHALELSQRGYKNVTVLDRMLPPVPDGSSVDISRVIRFDYADPFYGSLAKEAMEQWNSPSWKDFYYNSGFVVASEARNEPYVEQCKANLKQQKLPHSTFEGDESLIRHFPALTGGMRGASGYINPSGGWANATGAIRELATRCSQQGVSFLTGRRGTVVSLSRDGSRIVGVNTMEGFIPAAQVVVSTGAWTNGLISMPHATTASAQPVAFVQLSGDEASSLKGMPVVINLSSGVFIFPPTPDSNLLKIARHSHGFETPFATVNGATISTPKLLGSNAAASFIPEDADAALREGLRYMVPQFADKVWARKRLCWYSDTANGDFIVDHHPDIQGLFIAGGGAGHAFKFLPILGKSIADCFENKASEEMRAKWRLKRNVKSADTIICNDGSRRGPPKRKLTAVELAKL